MLGVFAEFERDMIAARVQAGIDRARAKGKRMGRPTVDTATAAAGFRSTPPPGANCAH